ncbi:hypothetical protein [Sulfurospirillum deleyianum]|uniref:Lipoprotein n=1 Tax=Sulfurospirillum deleyianum (strain ATCC 51133 / DSM 6946 / 5175) TaxID=525898 RepID=D1B5B0_SULD5|nr:hypothetical protein [Sulfurospirillum deleyianum]ACZ13280.1 conserved hypothetical protein [Sulfurospirillum deleyianum DSM 6946]
MRYLLIVFVMLFITGCSKISKENYDKIDVGMTYPQVIDLLGQANHCDSLIGMSDCTWGDEKRYIKIKFVADKVMLMHSKGLE